MQFNNTEVDTKYYFAKCEFSRYYLTSHCKNKNQPHKYRNKYGHKTISRRTELGVWCIITPALLIEDFVYFTPKHKIQFTPITHIILPFKPFTVNTSGITPDISSQVTVKPLWNKSSKCLITARGAAGRQTADQPEAGKPCRANGDWQSHCKLSWQLTLCSRDSARSTGTR